jgi:hypothetical protein
LQAFRDTREGDTALVGSEERLRGFGVRTVPNLLFGGACWSRHRERRDLRARARPGAVSR